MIGLTSTRKRLSMMIWLVLIIVFFAFVQCLFVPATAPQSTTANLSGMVVDESGAVVPDVKITLMSTSTGLQRQSLTDNEGSFTIPLLAPGAYTLLAELPGFATVTINDITLQSSVNASIQILLKPKALAESIDVLGTNSISAQNNQINLNDSSKKYSITGKQMVDLPILTSDSGRNTLGVMPFLFPGVTPTTVVGSAQTHVNQLGNQMSINGSRPSSIGFYLDGGDNNDHELNQAASPLPNPDALQELTIITNNYQADLGRSSGGILNAVVKSGTNRFRGNFRYFLINDALNARSFFDPHVSPDKLNTFGGQVGGPVTLPGLAKHRAFFFVDYEGTRSGSGVSTNLIVPSSQERLGIFTDLPPPLRPFDPLTNGRFFLGIIPAARIDPIARAYLNRYVPAPNDGDHSYREFLTTNLRNDQITTRTDYQIREADGLSVSYISNESSSDSDTGTLPIGSKAAVLSHSQNLVVRESHIFSPHTVNQFTAALTRLTFSNDNISPGATGVGPEELGFTGIHPQEEKFIGVPAVHINGTDVQIITGQGSNSDKTTWQIKDDLSVTRANHAWKWGGELRSFLQDTTIGNNNGSFLFTPTRQFGSGNAIANFLLGIPTAYTQTTGNTRYPRQHATYFYAMDDWRVRANLTVQLGIRYELVPPLIDKRDQVSVFRPGQKSTHFLNAPRGLLFVGDNDPILDNVQRGLYPTDRNNFAPRFGMAYSPSPKSGWRRWLFGNGKSVMRLGGGIFYDQTLGVLFTEVASTQPFSVAQNLSNLDIHLASGSLANPFGTRNNPWPVNLSSPLFIGTPQVQALDPAFRTAYDYQYNLTFQRELPGAILLEAAYVGNNGFKLNRSRELNIGPISSKIRGVESRRIYPQFSSIISQESSGRARYDSLQLRLRRRLKGGVMIEGSYVLSKALDNDSGLLANSLTNPLQWARSDYDRRHNFVMTYSYDLPRLHLPKFIGWMVNRWQVAGITEYRSGLPMDIIQSFEPTPDGEPLYGRPDLVGQYVRFDPRQEQTIIVNGAAQTGHFFFNPNAFQPVNAPRPEDDRPGTLGRNALEGPGISLWSLSINKQFRIAASHQISLRSDIRNLFNHANFQLPTVQADVATFGQVFLAAPGRTVQVSLRYSF